MTQDEPRERRKGGFFTRTLKQIALWVLMLIGGFVGSMVLLTLVVGGVAGLFLDEESILSHDSVAVIEVDDAIRDASKVLKALYESANNPKISGIVVRVDSPGGAVGPSQEIHAAIKRLKEKKKIVVSMGSVAASGGLYLSLAADRIYCQPGTLTGSIGVIMQTPNVSSITDRLGFKMMTVKSGKLKDVGNPFRPVEAGDEEFLRSVIKTTYDQFVEAVWEGRERVFTERGISREKVAEFADGRIIPGSTAKELGLVDEYGDLYDAARGVLALSGKPLPDGQLPPLTYPGRKLMRLQELFGAASKAISYLGNQLTLGTTVVSYRAPIS